MGGRSRSYLADRWFVPDWFLYRPEATLCGGSLETWLLDEDFDYQCHLLCTSPFIEESRDGRNTVDSADGRYGVRYVAEAGIHYRAGVLVRVALSEQELPEASFQPTFLRPHELD